MDSYLESGAVGNDLLRQVNEEMKLIDLLNNGSPEEYLKAMGLENFQGANLSDISNQFSQTHQDLYKQHLANAAMLNGQYIALNSKTAVDTYNELLTGQQISPVCFRPTLSST